MKKKSMNHIIGKVGQNTPHTLLTFFLNMDFFHKLKKKKCLALPNKMHFIQVLDNHVILFNVKVILLKNLYKIDCNFIYTKKKCSITTCLNGSNVFFNQMKEKIYVILHFSLL